MSLATTLLVVTNVLTLGLAVPMTLNLVRTRRAKRQGGRGKAWPIRRVRIDEFDSHFAPGEFGPTRDIEVHFVGRWMLEGVKGGTEDLEAWILAVLAKWARLLFEFGT